MDNNNNSKKNNRNKFKKWLTLFLLLTFIILIIVLFFLWRYNNVTTLTENEYNKVITTDKYNNNNVDSYKNTNSSVGQNTVVITGSFIETDTSGSQHIVNYKVEIDLYEYNTVIFPSMKDNAKLFPGLVVKDKDFVPVWESFLVNFVPFLLITGILAYVFIKMMRGSGGISSAFSMGKNRARQVNSTVKFSDVAGIEEEKLELTELVDYLKNNDKYVKLGARIPRGVLMEGPPGTGKTLLAKAVAGEAGVPFLSISGSEFEEMFVGVGASRIREMFNMAKKNSPSIIFIDEVDAVGRKRGSSIGASTNEQTLNQLLVEMDGFGTDSGVIVIAATNRVDVLDSALLRPGRFDRQIQIPLPDVNAREAILKLHSRNKKLSSEISFKRIAQRTPGFSGAQLENVLNEAIILTIREKRSEITIQDIDEAIDRVVAGPAKRSRVMRFMDKKIVSYHEAGHAVIGLKVENASKVQKVTIIPRGSAGGYTIVTPKEDIAFYSKEQLFSMIKGFLGGRAAEEIIFGKKHITTGAHDDLEKATSIAKKMIVEYGMSDLGLTQYENTRQQALGIQPRISETLSTKIDHEVDKMLKDCYADSYKIIMENRKLLELLAESLNVLETLTAEQIEYINVNKKLPNEVIEAKNIQKRYEEKEKKGHLFKIKPKNMSEIENDKIEEQLNKDKENNKIDNQTKEKKDIKPKIVKVKKNTDNKENLKDQKNIDNKENTKNTKDSTKDKKDKDQKKSED